MEVVDVGLVVHLDGVGTGRERRHIRAVRAGEADLEARADARDQRAAVRGRRLGRLGVGRAAGLVVVSPAPDHHSQRQECETDDQTRCGSVRCESSFVARSRRYARRAGSVRFRVPPWTCSRSPPACGAGPMPRGVARGRRLHVRQHGGRGGPHRSTRPDGRRSPLLEGSRPRRQAREGAGPRLRHRLLAHAERRRDARALRRADLGAEEARRQSRGAPASSPTPSRSATSFREGSRRAAPPALRRSSIGCPSTPHSCPATCCSATARAVRRCAPSRGCPTARRTATSRPRFDRCSIFRCDAFSFRTASPS